MRRKTPCDNVSILNIYLKTVFEPGVPGLIGPGLVGPGLVGTQKLKSPDRNNAVFQSPEILGDLYSR